MSADGDLCHSAAPARDDRPPQSSRGSRPSLPPPERSVQQEKHDDAQHRQGRHHLTPGDLHGSWCIVLMPLVLCHQDHCSQPRRCNTQPAVSRRRIPRSAAHRWVSRLSRIHRCSVGAWCLPPEAVHATCPRQHTSPGAQRVAAAGTPQGEETCQGAHTQSWVKCPFLGTRLGHGAGGGRCPSSRPLTCRRDSPCQGIAPRRPLTFVRH
jgi:hypothetical protein